MCMRNRRKLEEQALAYTPLTSWSTSSQSQSLFRSLSAHTHKKDTPRRAEGRRGASWYCSPVVRTSLAFWRLSSVACGKCIRSTRSVLGAACEAVGNGLGGKGFGVWFYAGKKFSCLPCPSCMYARSQVEGAEPKCRDGPSLRMTSQPLR